MTVTTTNNTLYVVATPIGNRDDISIRAIEVLRHCKRIYAEDTRHSKALLQHHGIDTALHTLHEHNETAAAEAVAAFIEQVGPAALISDAGTPLISDPGYRLVRACQAHGIKVSPIPGASALTAALCVAGLPTDRVTFAGFAPSKQAARHKWLGELAILPSTVVLYESPHRIMAALDDIADTFGITREMTMARELTKRFETIERGSVGAIRELLQVDSQQQRGEFVLLLAGNSDSAVLSANSAQAMQTLKILMGYLPLKDAAKCAAELTDEPRKALYKLGVELQNSP